MVVVPNARCERFTVGIRSTIPTFSDTTFHQQPIAATLQNPIYIYLWIYAYSDLATKLSNLKGHGYYETNAYLLRY